MEFWKLRDKLSVWDDLVLFGSRIVIPKGERKDVLRRLHRYHQGFDRALQTLFANIENTVGNCEKCQEHRPSLRAEPLQSVSFPSRPFQDVGADIFKYAGKYYLVYVNRYSGWSEAT